MGQFDQQRLIWYVFRPRALGPNVMSISVCQSDEYSTQVENRTHWCIMLARIAMTTGFLHNFQI